jgi:hypothetical protein
MTEFKDKAQQEAEERAVIMGEADKYFAPIDQKTSNGQLLMQAVGAPENSQFIVQRLESIEDSGDLFGRDEQLNTWFDQQIEAGNIKAPTSPVDKQRWLALMGIAASKKEGFSYGNVLIVPDYLPDDSEELQEYESVYGVGIIEDIIRRRETLKK